MRVRVMQAWQIQEPCPGLPVGLWSCLLLPVAAVSGSSTFPETPYPALSPYAWHCAPVPVRPGFGNATTDYTAPFGNTEAAIATRLQVGDGVALAVHGRGRGRLRAWTQLAMLAHGPRPSLTALARVFPYHRRQERAASRAAVLF